MAFACAEDSGSPKVGTFVNTASASARKPSFLVRALFTPPPTIAAPRELHVVGELPRRGITVLLIEHDMGFIAHLCDPVIVMAEGQVLTQGTFDEVRADHRVREAYLGRRAA